MSSEAIFKALADATRQRIMQVLLQHEVSVTELVEALGQPQSTVSRHLKVLRDADLISDRRNGVVVYYALSAAATSEEVLERRDAEGAEKKGTENQRKEEGYGPREAGEALEPSSEMVSEPSALPGAPEHGPVPCRQAGTPLDRATRPPDRATLPEDRTTLQAHLVRWLQQQPVPSGLQRRMHRVLQRRHEETLDFFASIGQRWDQMRTDCFGSSFHLEALSALLPKTWIVADIGAGTGYLLPHLAAVFEKVIAVEPVATLMEAARRRPELSGAGNVEFRSGDLRRLPLEEGEVDLAIAMLVLHHVGEPGAALREMRRAVKPGRGVLIVEQKIHQCESFREMMQDRWWGFAPETLAIEVRAAGLEDVRWHDLRTAGPTSAAAPETPELFVMTAEKSKSRNRVAGV